MNRHSSGARLDTEKQLDIMPQHIAIIMDGNGRWATQRFLPRIAGHKRGRRAVRTAIAYALKHQIGYLTLFAFSSENWERPAEEVDYLMRLFESALTEELTELSQHHVRLKIIGDVSRFSETLQHLIRQAESKTATETKLVLTIAANYGGRWDIVQAMRRALTDGIPPSALNETTAGRYFSLYDAPAPDLLIRTGGEYRLSNFLLWDLAYTELYFTDTLWPDFDDSTFDQAIAFYHQRERRFGRLPK